LDLPFVSRERTSPAVVERDPEPFGPRPAGPRHDLSALRLEDEERITPRRRWPFVLVGVAALLVVALVVVPRLDLGVFAPRVQTATVQRVTQAEADTVLTATGYTYARTRAAVGARIIGRVVELPVDEGDRVREGDLIAVLDSEDLRASLAQAEAQVLEARARLADAEREARRQRELVEAKIVPQADLDAAQTQLDVARAVLGTQQARVDAVQAQLAYTVIRSPIDGVVIERNVEVGEMVAPGGFTSQQSTGAIVRLADPASLEVEADVNESFISRLRPGQPASIRVDAVPDRAYAGRLRQIVPTADRQRAVVEVKVTIDDRDERLVPDMSCTVTFLEEGSRARSEDAEAKLYVPAAAVLSQAGASFVYRVREARLEKVAIEIAGGESEGDRVEVASGLAAGDEVVVAPGPDLRDGQRVRTGG
jgi:RND family efflux transporter MFP subunit